MTSYEYETLQEQLSKKLKNNSYARSGCTKYETGYQEGILAAKSILSAFYHAAERNRGNENH